ncbi:MAG: macrolide ABC transporter ATP-binding protein [Myxococcales bacterium]|nr:macrolide ABC transporter ATP-binding protein [Myxococcales bacterium]|tara:strand:- start:1487 stop:2173 length:687 start_codon:yes stop_codon:yes gene_type:complete
MIKLTQVSKRYQQATQDEFALREVDLTIDAGEFVAIVGTSGSGKTTLLNIMGGLDRDYSGTVVVDGKNLSQLSDQELARFRNQSVGFVFQHFNLLDHMTAAENVALPNSFAPTKDRKTTPLTQAEEALRVLGLGAKTQEKPNNLSGGQKQRVAIARALFFQPKILLCDEPTGSLDTKTGHQIIETFEQLNKDGYTIIIITHERRVSDAAKRVIQIEDGCIVDSGAGTQ